MLKTVKVGPPTRPRVLAGEARNRVGLEDVLLSSVVHIQVLRLISWKFSWKPMIRVEKSRKSFEHIQTLPGPSRGVLFGGPLVV